MYKLGYKILSISIFALLTSIVYSQTNDSLISDSTAFSKEELEIMEEEQEEEFIFNPIIGLGAGGFTFYGDISKGKAANNAGTGRIAYNLIITQPITKGFDLNFHVLFGKLAANERSVERNLNFESKITTGGASIAYNFQGLLPDDRTLEPYISVGVESVEFLSKTDLKDTKGNVYYYWSDGSIRNMPEDDTNNSDAIRLYRDYSYESDIRELNIDGFGKYAERTWAIPVSVGARLHLSDKVKFWVGSTMHFTFTDFIDGVSEESTGQRQGDKQNDRFLYTSFNLSYNLSVGKSKRKSDRKKYQDVDFIALDLADEDADGVRDFDDDSPHTPEGEDVTASGVPYDDDNDGVFNHQDLEKDSPDSAYVDEYGIELTDSMLHLRYLMRHDSTGEFAQIKRTLHIVGEIKETPKAKTYAVKIGEYEEGIPANLVDKFLSIPDVEIIEDGNKTTIIAGNYDNLPDAVKKLMKIQGMDIGIETSGVVEKDKVGNITDVDKTEVDTEIAKIDPDASSNTTTFYRVQLGAFRKSLSSSAFNDVPDLVAVPSEDGLTRYYSGSFDNLQEASERKVKMLSKGFPDAFVVPFKSGKRISLIEGGATPSSEEFVEQLSKVETIEKETNIDKNKVRFKVQVGAYEKQLPIDVLEKFLSLGNIQQLQQDGTTKYITGDFTKYNEAEAYKSELLEKGFEDAFVVGEFDGNIISAKEAEELIK